MLTPPGTFVETDAVPEVVPVPPATVAFAPDEEKYVRAGTGFLSSLPKRSMTVGVRVTPVVLFATANEVFVAAFPTCRFTDCTRQVSKYGCNFPLLFGIWAGWLVTPAMLAKI